MEGNGGEGKTCLGSKKNSGYGPDSPLLFDITDEVDLSLIPGTRKLEQCEH